MMETKGGPVELLAPCGKCRLVKDRETGFIVGPDVMLFRTLNGSSRFAWQISGRTVAVIWVQSENGIGYINGVAVHPEYQNSGFLAMLYKAALRDYKRLSLGPLLTDNRDTRELIQGLTGGLGGFKC